MKNEFLDNNKIKKIYFEIDGGESNIVFKYPNELQIKEIKDMIGEKAEMIYKNQPLDLNNSIDIYRYIMTNLCDMENIDEYKDDELRNSFENGNKNVKDLKMAIEDLIEELFVDYLYEIKQKYQFTEKTLKVFEINTKGLNIIREMDKLAKKYKINFKPEDIQNPEKMKKVFDKIKNKLDK